MIVHTNEPVTLIGAGDLSQNTLNAALTVTDKIIAADGGASLALRFGVTPDVVIGDMDSIDPQVQAEFDAANVYPVSEQDSTDFEKVLQRVDAPVYVAVGFLGARVDHQLACFTALTRHPDKKIILLGEVDVVFLAPARVAMPLMADTRVSLYPMGSVCGSSTGLNWPIDGLKFAPNGQIGTSNHATGPVELKVDAPLMLVVLPADQFSCVLEGLTAAAQWPARAE